MKTKKTQAKQGKTSERRPVRRVTEKGTPPAGIDRLREEIDLIDDLILDLLNERATVAIEIGKEKASRNLGYYSPERERSIFERLCARNPGPFSNDAVRACFREILSASLSLEMPLRVAFLGPRASFTHLACLEHFGRSANLMAESNIREVFESVERERADYGVIPIENSIEGVVGYNLDLLMESDLKISAEIMLDISLCLVSLSERLEDIRRVYSHPHALAQCRNWLDAHLNGAEVVEVESTARASEIAAKEPQSAAVASGYAAKLYDLNLLQKGIQDHPLNFTRFLVIGTRDAERTGKDKTSLMFTLEHDVGALHSALKPLADHGINLTKIESRPHKGRTWEYFFFVDTEGHRTDPKFVAALEECRAVCRGIKMLGSYPRGREVGRAGEQTK